MNSSDSIYEKVEKWYYEYIIDKNTNLSFIDWIRKNKK